MQYRGYGMILIAILLCHLAFAEGQGEKTKVKGLIVGRAGDIVMVRTTKGDVHVELTDETKVQQPKGLFKMRRQDVAFSALMPGLKIEAEGHSATQNRVVAEKVKFSGDDLQRAQAMQAALDPTKQAVAKNEAGIEANQQAIEANRQQIEENEREASQRFASLADYDTKGEATIHFASGSSDISAEDRAELKKLAQAAAQQKQYLIEVMGFADSRGNAAMNQRLSMDRAQGVIAYLIQGCGIPPRRIVAPGAMGEVASTPNETASGHAENRRVEVKILVNRGVAGDRT